MYENFIVDPTDPENVIEAFAILLKNGNLTLKEIEDFVKLSGISEETVEMVMEKINIRAAVLKMKFSVYKAATSAVSN